MEKATAYTDLPDAKAAGASLGRQVMSELSGTPDAIIVFAAPSYDHATLLVALKAECPGAILIGSSSAGEFTHASQGEGAACALALKSDETRFALGVGRDLQASAAAAAHEIVSTFEGVEEPTFYRAALVMTDALAGHAPALIQELIVATKTQYQMFGGGAGDNARFTRTVVFNGTEVLTDAAVALEIVSPNPIGVGVGHGWEPAADTMRVTDTEGLKLIGLNGLPASRRSRLTPRRPASPSIRGRLCRFFFTTFSASRRRRVTSCACPWRSRRMEACTLPARSRLAAACGS